jgi:acyl-CoA thioester hydrolase
VAYETETRVSFRDLDVFGHVNNAVYFTWFETARVEYLAQLFDIRDVATLPVTMARTECVYVRPVSWNETLVVRCKITRFGGKSYDMDYLVATKVGDVAAMGRSTLVFFDRVLQASVDVPEWFKERTLRHQGDLERFPVSALAETRGDSESILTRK